MRQSNGENLDTTAEIKSVVGDKKTLMLKDKYSNTLSTSKTMKKETQQSNKETG
jgi:hypothetical protein